MSNKMMVWIDKLVEKSENPKGLYALEKLFIMGIPFNKPHGISFQKLTHTDSRLKMRNKKLNHNHLKGIHACAICTLGEFTAGLLLSKNFPMAKYRVIMKNLNAEYLKQARSNVYGNASISPQDIESIKQQIASDDKADIELRTVITNENNEDVAIVTTIWQLKDWSKTHY